MNKDNNNDQQTKTEASSSSTGHRPSTLQSRRSAESILSTGMGDPSDLNGPPLAPPLPRLYPEGGAEQDEPVFDCIVFLIYCPVHGNLAVGKVEKCGTTWLPFVAFAEGVSWEDACTEGITALIGRTDAEADAEAAEAMTPTYSLRYLHLLRVQLPTNTNNSRTALRISVFVSLIENSENAFRCCQNSDRVNWLPLSYIYSSTVNVDRVWGPELWVLPRMLNLQAREQTEQLNTSSIFIHEYSINMALYYLEKQEANALEHRFLVGAHITRTQVLQIYSDYVEHVWPSFYMSFEAFRAYLLKYGHPSDVLLTGSEAARKQHLRLRLLFATFCTPAFPYIDFHSFLLGLVAMEPTTSSSLTWRLHFLFRYYANGKTTMSAADLAVMLSEAKSGWSSMKATEEAKAILLRRTSVVLTVETFIEEFSGTAERQFASLCRHPKSIIAELSWASSALVEEKNSAAAAGPQTCLVSRSSRGSCWSCRRQEYVYGTHYVTLGGGDGRCTDARLMQKVLGGGGPTAEYRRLHSLECVFTIGSVPNIFMDLIRDFFEKFATLRLTGLLSTKPEWPIFAKYLRILVKEYGQLAAQEEKLQKVNAPAMVIGALGGSLRDLLAIQHNFYASFPVIPESLVFLGNYSGEGGFSVEVLVYLLSLKLVSPNKVYLLRGRHELDDGYEGLRKECESKYGLVYGETVHSLLVSVFSVLPIAVLVDDNILCTHSGIPSREVQLDALLKLPKELVDLKKESPSAYEMITRLWIYPAEESCPTDDGHRQKPASVTDVKKVSGPADRGKTGERAQSNRSSDEIKNLQTGSPLLKIKPAFLCSLKGKRKPCKKAEQRLIKLGTTESRAINRSPFSQQELLDFLDANDLTFLLHTSSNCPKEFHIAGRCLTFSSCSTPASPDVDKRTSTKQPLVSTAVVHIDRVDCSIRFIRYDCQAL